MMRRAWTLVGGSILLAAAAGLAGCSSSDTPEDGGGDMTGGTSGTGATTSGGTAGTSTGGTAGTETGGTAGTAPTGGTSGSGGNPPECQGISRGDTCTNVGTECANLKCGLADSGTRTCNCTGTWECTSCDFTGAWTETRPATLEPCPAGIVDEAECTVDQDHLICSPNADGETCACWMSPSDGQSWDCDSAPSSWGM